MGNNSDDEDRRRQRREEEERERNRREVMKRKRQWEVVDSDDGGGGGDAPDRGSRRRSSRSRSRSRSEESDDAAGGGEIRRHTKQKRRRRRGRERSRSASSSRSRSRDRHKKDGGRKKDRRHRRRSKDRKKRHRRGRDRKEDRSHKKKSRRRSGDRRRDGDRRGDASASYSSSSLSEDEREILERSSKRKDAKAAPASGGGGAASFGKYGIVNPSDLHSSTKVKSSFERWLAEVKGIPSFTGPKHELMEYFGEYAENYNTATLPHVKYYDYDKWEMEEYQRKKSEAERAAVGRDNAAGGGGVALDELRHREEMAERARKKRLEEVRLVQYGMTAEKREEMKHQARLRHEMAVAYKTGDEETRKRLQKRLEPEEIVRR